MYDNRYEGVLDEWKVKLIRRRARRMGFRRQEFDDAQQQVVLALLDFQFDEANGASEKTALTVVIDGQLAMIRRAEMRAENRIEAAKETCKESCEQPEPTLSIDVAQVVGSLPELDQRICQGLARGQSVNQLADVLDISWHAVRTRIESIRRHFERHGLTASCLSHKDGGE